MLTGHSKVQNSAQIGFSYIELMVSVLIIGVGFVGYAELISRIKASQYHAGKQLQFTLKQDYTEQNIRVNRNVCLIPQFSSNALPAKSRDSYPINAVSESYDFIAVSPFATKKKH